MGRSRKSINEKKKIVNVTVRPDTYNLLLKISENRECSVTWIVQKCLDLTLSEELFYVKPIEHAK